MGRTKKNETKVLSEDPKKTYKKLHTEIQNWHLNFISKLTK